MHPPSGLLRGSFELAPALLWSGPVAAIICVPENSMCTLCVPSISSLLSSCPGKFFNASFICGTDSPVSVASFTTASPFNKTQSQGTMPVFSSNATAGFFAGAGVAVAEEPFDATTAVDADFGTDALTEMISPGNRSSVEMSCHSLFRKALILYGLELIEFRVPKVLILWNTVVDSNMRTMNICIITNCQYSSSIHNKAVKN
mmetsp:Transcript_79550/g.125472  ORF Transcript_79550/g.125472 Transcript_79550/m.125472 type:complete len:202 (-) Transcript_79550:898-1503(-)